MRKLVGVGLVMAGLAMGLSLDVATYGGHLATNAGVVVRVRELPVCMGVELVGNPGVFGGLSDGCDF